MTQILWTPNPGPQTFFLASRIREVMYGGAAGGGKSEALVALALRWVDNKNHRAIILRRTRPQLQETIDRTLDLYTELHPDAFWRESRLRWEFPTGAVIAMGHAEQERDILNYKSFQHNLIIFDELTSFTEYQYKFMFSRNRTADPTLPLLIRSGTNPGDIGHEWVYKRFILNRNPYEVYTETMRLLDPEGRPLRIDMDRQYVPATVFDNPRLADRSGYIAGMADMGDDMRDAMLYGRWDLFEGQFFKKAPERVPPGLKHENHYTIRCMDYGYIDPAAIYWLIVYPDLKKIDIAGELYASELAVPDLARMALRREARLQAEYGVKPPLIRVADPSMFKTEATSGQSVNTLLGKHGLWHDKANNDRAAGWAMLRSLISDGTLRVWEGMCPQLMITLPTLQYDPKNPDDIKSGGKDHGADAMRYGSLAYYTHGGEQALEPKVDPEVQDTVFPKLVAGINRKRTEIHGLPGFDFR
jgi:hypothetical protein